MGKAIGHPKRRYFHWLTCEIKRTNTRVNILQAKYNSKWHHDRVEKKPEKIATKTNMTYAVDKTLQAGLSCYLRALNEC